MLPLRKRHWAMLFVGIIMIAASIQESLTESLEIVPGIIGLFFIITALGVFRDPKKAQLEAALDQEKTARKLAKESSRRGHNALADITTSTAPPPTDDMVVLTVLNVARQHRGRITPAEVGAHAGLPLNRVRDILERLVNEGFCQQLVGESGLVVYYFPEFESERSKRDVLEAAGLLDSTSREAEEEEVPATWHKSKSKQSRI